MKTMLILAASVVMLGTYARAADDQRIDPQLNAQLRSADKLWDDAFNAANPDGLLPLYTEDAVFVTPVSEQIRGPAAIARLVKRFIEVGFKDHTFNVIDAHSVGNTAYSFSSYTVKNGNGATNVGYALKVLQRQPDGSWKIQYQMFNQVQSK